MLFLNKMTLILCTPINRYSQVDGVCSFSIACSFCIFEHQNHLSVFYAVGSPPTEVRVLQESPTTIRVFWKHPEPVESTTGYQIYYTGPTEGSLPADNIDSNNEIITGLVNGQKYHISVAGKSTHLESEPVAAYNGPISLSK